MSLTLAPADLKKDASSFDLPIAIGMLIGTGQLAPDDLDDIAIVGELALDGNMRPIKGALAMALACKQQGLKRLIVPSANARSASGGGGRSGARRQRISRSDEFSWRSA